jgi:GTP pyrophosphokinase
VISQGRLDEIAPQFGVARGEDLLAAAGFGKVSPRQVVERLLSPEELEQREAKPPKLGIKDTVKRALGLSDEPGVSVEGMHGIMVHRARCCTPLPGEPIVGYVTRGKGVSVHSESCRNVTQLLLNPERRVPVVWSPSKIRAQPVGLALEIDDRQGVLAEVTAKISSEKVNIRHLESHIDGRGQGQISAVVDVADLKQLNSIKEMLLKIDGVRTVRRQRSI